MTRNRRNRKSKRGKHNATPVITMIVVGVILFFAFAYFVGMFVYSSEKNYSCFDTNQNAKQIYVRTMEQDTSNKLCMQMGIQNEMDNVNVESVKYIPDGYKDITDSISEGCQGDNSNPVGNKNVLCRTLDANPFAQVFAFQDQ